MNRLVVLGLVVLSACIPSQQSRRDKGAAAGTSVPSVASAPGGPDQSGPPSGGATSGNPLAGKKFFVPLDSPAAQYLRGMRSSDVGYAQVQELAQTPQAIWLGEWNSNVRADISRLSQIAQGAGSLPIFVVYGIPNRDCGQYSSGGLPNQAAYFAWVDSLVAGLGDRPAVIVIEPDALGHLGSNACNGQSSEYLASISGAVSRLASAPRAILYLDMGAWLAPAKVREFTAAIDPENKIRGYSMNVSAYNSTPELIAICKRFSDNKPCLFDTGRNGNGNNTNGDWCNPTGRAMGAKTTGTTGNARIDGFAWIKNPGESDGECLNGAYNASIPAAGVFWKDSAIELVDNAKR